MPKYFPCHHSAELRHICDLWSAALLFRRHRPVPGMSQHISIRWSFPHPDLPAQSGYHRNRLQIPRWSGSASHVHSAADQAAIHDKSFPSVHHELWYLKYWSSGPGSVSGVFVFFLHPHLKMPGTVPALVLRLLQSSDGTILVSGTQTLHGLLCLGWPAGKHHQPLSQLVSGILW